MFLPWHKSATILLSPEGVFVHAGGKTLCYGQQTDSIVGPRSWQTMLAELEQHLPKIAAKNIRIIVSNHYVRYAVLPWQNNVMIQHDLLTLAKLHLAEIYGKLSDGWHIQIAKQGYGKPLVICAIDQLLLEGITSLAKQQDWSLQKIEPALITVTNHYHRQLKNNTWFIMSESQHIVLAQAERGRWTQFSAMRLHRGHEQAEGLAFVKSRMRIQQHPPEHWLLFGNAHQLPNNDEAIFHDRVHIQPIKQDVATGQWVVALT